LESLAKFARGGDRPSPGEAVMGRDRGMSSLGTAFSSESLPGPDPGWIPVRVKKTRQNKSFGSDSTERIMLYPCTTVFAIMQ
jgi:hypothetical protein